MIQSVARGLIPAIFLLVWAGCAHAAQYAALVMDARTGKVIYSRNADTAVHPASLTKMMTLYIVFDQVRRGRLSLDQKVRISSNAASEPPSKLGLRAGQQIELRYLIRASAVKSANDAATALGEAVAGSEEQFARVMTAYAKAMGMNSTTFRNAHGLTQDGHMSTARDMATLGRRLIYDFPQYYNLFSRASTSAGVKTVQNTNRRLLQAYPGADGIKTGYTRAAGFSLVASARRDDKRVIVAMLGGQTSASRNAEVARLMDLGFGKMPRRAQVVPLAPIRVAGLSAPEPERVAVRGSTAGIAESAGSRMAALSVSGRPMPRALGRGNAMTRSSETIAAAIAEVNAELKAVEQASRSVSLNALMGRPAPRPDAVGSDDGDSETTTAGLASTFAARPAAPLPRAETEPVALAVAPNAPSVPMSTGGNDWGVQLGTYRAKGDAERQLLTTALKDVPDLSGGLRRVEAASVQGVTVYRAQFVGLSQLNAVAACAALKRMQSDCLPIAPGT